MTGTFYACPTIQHRQAMLTPEELRRLSATHEIGAHSMTHPKMTKISREQAKKELSASKEWVERITGKPCTMFCYPYGDENSSVRSLAQEAGFRGARCTEAYACSTEDPFALPATLHVYPFPFRPVMNRHAFSPLQKAWPHARRLQIPLLSMRGWLPFAKALFQKAHERNESYFHLWGHSAEVTKYGMWSHLESFLAYVQSFPGVEYVPNSSLV